MHCVNRRPISLSSMKPSWEIMEGFRSKTKFRRRKTKQSRRTSFRGQSDFNSTRTSKDMRTFVVAKILSIRIANGLLFRTLRILTRLKPSKKDVAEQSSATSDNTAYTNLLPWFHATSAIPYYFRGSCYFRGPCYFRDSMISARPCTRVSNCA